MRYWRTGLFGIRCNGYVDIRGNGVEGFWYTVVGEVSQGTNLVSWGILHISIAFDESLKRFYL